MCSHYKDDLHEYFRNSTVLHGVSSNTHPLDNNLVAYLKLFVLLYADDTVIISESADDLQNAIDLYEQYCDQWKLTVNTCKAKILVIQKGRRRNY